MKPCLKLANRSNEGHEEGFKVGLAEGHAKGVAEGHAEGVAEGRAEGALELVKAMLASGVTAEQLTKQGVPADLIAKAQAEGNWQA